MAEDADTICNFAELQCDGICRPPDADRIPRRPPAAACLRPSCPAPAKVRGRDSRERTSRARPACAMPAAVWMPSCPAPLTWKKILFCRFSRISRSSMRRDIYMMRNARIRSGASNRVGSSRSSGSVAALVSIVRPTQCSNGARTGRRRGDSNPGGRLTRQRRSAQALLAK